MKKRKTITKKKNSSWDSNKVATFVVAVIVMLIALLNFITQHVTIQITFK